MTNLNRQEMTILKLALRSCKSQLDLFTNIGHHISKGYKKPHKLNESSLDKKQYVVKAVSKMDIGYVCK